ncbi:MAG: RNA polymerase sigma factor [Actinomycetota bacterium]
MGGRSPTSGQGPGTPGSPPDDELVRSFLGGDREAFGALVERHERRVYNLAFRMLGNGEEARDTSQDVFLTCLRKLSGFRGASSFTTWLHRITVNACYDVLRKRGREELVDEDAGGFPEPQAPPTDLAEEAALAVDVQRALLQVPDDFRVVLVMHDVQGIPYEEIAEALGTPVGTVKSRLHRGRIALATALGGREGIAGGGWEQPGGSRPSNREVTRE